jgi:hypothetical protein
MNSESNPELNLYLDDDIEMYGMWYKETYDIVSGITEENGVNIQYKIIDSFSKEIIYTFDGIDYKRDNFTYLFFYAIIYEIKNVK